MITKKIFQIVLMVIVAILFSYPTFQAVAQDDYPSRPIEVIVPWPPGSPIDLGIRFFADKWAEFLGQPVIVINKPGASGAIGAKYVAHAKPDGYTFLGTSDTLITTRLEREDAGYNLDSFSFVFDYGKLIAFFSVKSDSRWKTFNDFLKEAKGNPGKLKYATFGPNSVTVMVAEMLTSVAGVKLTFVPFKSTPDSLTAVAGGNADIAVTFGLAGIGRSGLIRPLAISNQERVTNFPDVPTLKELGYPIKWISQHIGLAAPIKVPEKTLSKFKDAHNKVRVKYEKEINEKLTKIDLYPVYVDGKAAMEELKEREKLYKEFYSQIVSKFK